jgi:predicted O-methyltransferase YrrM
MPEEATVSPVVTKSCRSWDTWTVTEAEGLLGRVREARRVLMATGPKGSRGPGDFERVSLPTEDSDVLRDLLIADESRVVIEIGLAYGSSALAIAEALVSLGPDGARHLIIDAFQDRFDDTGWDLIGSVGLAGLCSLVRERSQLVLPRLIGDGFAADAAFVDGSHVFHNVYLDLAFLCELVDPGGLIILDDCEWPSVATAARYFEINAGWQPQPIERESRLRAYRLPSPRIEARFEDFKDFGLDPHADPCGRVR